MNTYKRDNSQQDSNCFINFFKSIFQDKIKLIVFISIILVVIILIIVIAVVASKKKVCGVSKKVYNIALKELEEHNKYRKLHKVDDLKINCDLMKIAQKYSEKLQKGNVLMHSGDEYKGDDMGENLYWISLKKYKPPDATYQWYIEIDDYDFSTGDSKNGKKIGHFTQVVWKETKELGVGVSCGKNGCFVVANYYPAGNYIGEFTSNVLEKNR